MVRLHRIGVLRTATVLAVMYGLLSLVIWAIVGVFLVAGLGTTEIPGMPGFDVGAGIVGVLIAGAVLSLVYGLLGWVFTAIACVFYNWVAGFTGGVEFELRTAPVPPAPAAPPAAPPAPPPAASPPAAPPPMTPPSDPSAS
jgi:hypothetical protein